MKSNFDIIIFDQDGTLLNTGISIIKSIMDVLKEMNMPLPEEKDRRKFVGPPIRKGLAQICGFDKKTCNKIALRYREYYEQKYWDKNYIYPGILDLLLSLNTTDAFTAVATSRPKTSALKILKARQFLDKFDVIATPEDANPHVSKKELIGAVIESYYVKTGMKPENVIMVGDTIYDIEGANETGIESVAVTYGFGSREELYDCNPTYFADSAGDLKKILLLK